MLSTFCQSTTSDRVSPGEGSCTRTVPSACDASSLDGHGKRSTLSLRSSLIQSGMKEMREFIPVHQEHLEGQVKRKGTRITPQKQRERIMRSDRFRYVLLEPNVCYRNGNAVGLWIPVTPSLPRTAGCCAWDHERTGESTEGEEMDRYVHGNETRQDEATVCRCITRCTNGRRRGRSRHCSSLTPRFSLFPLLSLSSPLLLLMA